MDIRFIIRHPVRTVGVCLYKSALALNPILKRDSYLVTGKYEIPEELTVNILDIDVCDDRDLTSGINTILPETLDVIIDKKKFIGKRILEVGPKFGHQSKWLDENLEPSSLTFLELSQKDSFTKKWINDIKCPKKVIYDSIIGSKELMVGEKFDLIFCAGVLYHTVEHFKILNVLRRLLKDDGTLLFQTSIDPFHDDAVVLLQWSGFGQAGSYSRPSKSALFQMLHMTGWDDIDYYTRYRPTSETVLMTCKKSRILPIAYDGLSFGGSTV